MSQLKVLGWLGGFLRKKQEPSGGENVNLSTQISDELFWKIRDGIAELLAQYQPASGSSGNAVAFLNARTRYIRSMGVYPEAYTYMVGEKASADLAERKRLLAKEIANNKI